MTSIESIARLFAIVAVVGWSVAIILAVVGEASFRRRRGRRAAKIKELRIDLERLSTATEDEDVTDRQDDLDVRVKDLRSDVLVRDIQREPELLRFVHDYRDRARRREGNSL